MNVIETRGLTRTFGMKEAVHSLDLAVPAGTVCALLGPNGAGKTTTIKLLMNLIRPTRGEARVLGVDSRGLGVTEKARIGYVSENQELPDWMSVRGFLDYCRGFYPTWDSELENQLLTKLALPEDRKIKHLSRGMRMKTMLLAALAYRPELLVLDEPFSGLDPAVRDDFVRGVFAAAGEGDWSVLISSHDIDEVERIADWVAIIDDGRLRLSESLESLQGRFRKVDVTLREGATIPDGELPAEWTDIEQAGMLLRFVETDYRGDERGRGYAERFPDAVVSLGVMSLRDIYLAVMRMPKT
ncbi:MAG: ABC transporter ATP-binding protein [Opitutaceae bacterium]|jgi:ABC-2 type transport system ATP-binding protein